MDTMVTHYVVDTAAEIDREEIQLNRQIGRAGLVVVPSTWVVLSYLRGRQLDPSCFEVDGILAGCIFSAAGFEKATLRRTPHLTTLGALFPPILAHGGRLDTAPIASGGHTHLLVATGSETEPNVQIQVAAAHSHGIIVVGVHWLSASLDAGRLLPTSNFTVIEAGKNSAPNLRKRPALDPSSAAESGSAAEATLKSLGSSDKRCRSNVEGYLTGIVLFLDEHGIFPTRNEPDNEKFRQLCDLIQAQGATIAADYSTACTHVLTDVQGPVYDRGLADGKHMVSSFWLNDVLKFHRCPEFTTAIYSPFKGDFIQSCKGLSVCITGYSGHRRFHIREMVKRIGASCTGNFTKSNNVLIAQDRTTAKSKMATKWGVPQVTDEWLEQVVLQWEFLAYNDPRFAVPAIVQTITLADDGGGSESRPERNNRAAGGVHFYITGHTTSEKKEMSKMLEDLGAISAHRGHTHATITHLIASKICRTKMFLLGMCQCSHVVTSHWVRASHSAQQLLPESNFPLIDSVNEDRWKFSLVDAIAAREGRSGGVLGEHQFYISPQVVPPRLTLVEIVLAAGGVVRDELPTTIDVTQNFGVGDSRKLTIITCPLDYESVSPFLKANELKAYSAELILSAALTQRVDFSKNLIPND